MAFKNLFLCFFLLFFSIKRGGIATIHAENPQPQEKQISKKEAPQNSLAGLHGETLIKKLLSLSREKLHSNTEKALEYINEAVSLSGKMGLDSLRAEAFYQLGKVSFLIGDPAKALESHLNALKLFRSLDNKSREADALHLLGVLYQDQGLHSQGLEYFLQSLKISESIDDRSKMAHTLQWLASTYSSLNQYKNALDYAFESMEIQESLKNHSGLSMIYSEIGTIYLKLDNQDRALNYFEKALEAAKKINAAQGQHAVAHILMNISTVYHNKQAYSKAVEHIEAALKMAKKLGNDFLQIHSYQNLAAINSSQAKFEDSNQWLFKAEKSSLQSGMNSLLPAIYLSIAENYKNMELYNKAVDYALKAKAGKAASVEPNTKKQALEILIDIWRKKEEYQKAFAAQKEYINVKDSLFNKEKAEQVAKIQSRYELNKKEKEILLLEKKQAQQNRLFYISLAGAGLLVVIAILVFSRQRMRMKKRKTELKNSQLHEKQMSQEMDFKNRQLTSHTLNHIQKNKILKDVLQDVSRTKQGEPSLHQLKKTLADIDKSVKKELDQEGVWKHFRLYFEKVHPDFFEGLKQHCPNLTPNDLRLCALIRLNLTIKEIAELQAISPESVKMARYRLRQKLGLETGQNLTKYLMNIPKKG